MRLLLICNVPQLSGTPRMTPARVVAAQMEVLDAFEFNFSIRCRVRGYRASRVAARGAATCYDNLQCGALQGNLGAGELQTGSRASKRLLRHARHRMGLGCGGNDPQDYRWRSDVDSSAWRRSAK